jgi:hypothetical protein
MPDFLIAAVIRTTADSEADAVAFAQAVARYSPDGILTVSDHPKVEIDPDSVIDPVLRTEEEMEVHPPFGDNLEAGDIEWLRTHEQHGIRVDLYDVHSTGKRGLPLFGYRLSWRTETDNPQRPIAVQDQMGDARANEVRWEIIFTGEDYEPGPGHDDDMVLADLLGFLSSFDELTDSDVTPRQQEWLTHYRDELATWSAELEGELDDGRG